MRESPSLFDGNAGESVGCPWLCNDPFVYSTIALQYYIPSKVLRPCLHTVLVVLAPKSEIFFLSKQALSRSPILFSSQPSFLKYLSFPIGDQNKCKTTFFVSPPCLHQYCILYSKQSTKSTLPNMSQEEKSKRKTSKSVQRNKNNNVQLAIGEPRKLHNIGNFASSLPPHYSQGLEKKWKKVRRKFCSKTLSAGMYVQCSQKWVLFGRKQSQSGIVAHTVWQYSHRLAGLAPFQKSSSKQLSKQNVPEK